MLNGPSKAGEIWFAEADTPVGPWAYARRVVTHGEYNFYNPTQHPFFDQEGGRLIYFEGTYSDFFSGARAQTPRYDYSIDAQPPRGCSPEGRPIGRVWKVPGSVLTLDWKAKPNTPR